MVADHVAAVADTVEEGLGPVPRGVGTDGPPERARPPQTEYEREAKETNGDQTEWALSGVIAVAYAEDGAQDESGSPEAI